RETAMARCRDCGRELGDHPHDAGFSLPDVVWNLDANERKRRAKTSSDLCVLDGARFFLRGIAFVPILETADCFGWGFWVEVDRAAFGRYLDLFKADAPEGSRPGRVSSRIHPKGMPRSRAIPSRCFSGPGRNARGWSSPRRITLSPRSSIREFRWLGSTRSTT
ncbi:MAG: DUF2199 domain-containing protein, partial [Myxococcales bacterium]